MTAPAPRPAVLVGAGALGSHAALFARNLPIKLTVVDFDRVEQKNVLSQFHPRPGVGRNKAQALQQALQGMFNVRVEAVPHRLAAENADALLGKADLLLDCLDNGASRRVMQGLARARGIPCLHGALSADGQLGRVVWDEVFTIDDEATAGQATCEDGEHLPFIAGVAAVFARSLQTFLASGARTSFQITPTGVTVIDRR